jgi:hypothetical protein
MAEKQQNIISRLENPDGSMTEDCDDMKEITRNFYKNLYSTEGVSNMAKNLLCFTKIAGTGKNNTPYHTHGKKLEGCKL